ncbi:acyltransferase [Acidocella aquatica]|uniref:Acyltransferase n=1 Tax=Acidocella aquatica TaxID=1922313 RepID=A0ABQ6A1Y6_9PROT|nr:acyltransferase [Acidocella aquatica]GLR66169.1 acyltransferase [Acidocella aquatica]
MNLKQEISDLTVGRALLAAWVFTYHVDLYLNFSAWLGPCAGIVRHGYLGVDGFFILSGLILARVHPELSRAGIHPQLSWESFGTLQPFHPRAWHFWGKRLARIYPLHFVTILLFAAIFGVGIAFGVTPRDPARFSFPAFLENIFLLQGWGFSSHGAWNYPSWSVSAEWAGYLLFPVLWYIISYLDPVVSVAFILSSLTALGLIDVEYMHTLNLAFGSGLMRFFPEFLAGIAAARIVPNYADFLPARVLAVLAVALILIFTSLGSDVLTVAALWLLLFSLTMQADAERPPLIGHIQWLRWLGLLSYAFYMSFALAELLLAQFFRHQGWTPASHSLFFAAGMLAITFAVAVVLHSTVEVPCRRAADRWLDTPTSPLLPIRSK